MSDSYEDGFERVMEYQEKTFGDFKGKTSKDLRAWLQQHDTKGCFPKRLLNRWEQTDAWAERIEEEPVAEPEKPREKPNRRTIKAWHRNPNSVKLKGRDDATRRAILEELKMKAKKSLERGYTVKRRENELYRVEKDGRLRSIITGRYVKRK